MQRLLRRTSQIPDLNSIQGVIEFGLNKVLRSNDAVLNISSRTDGGVHAIEATAHFYYKCLEADEEPVKTVSPEKLCESLNLFFEKNQTEIRMKRIVQVDDEFYCRNVTSRTYCYQLAVVKSNEAFSCPNTLSRTALLPITDVYRCQLVPQPFNPSAIFEACKIFIGTKNFRSFSKVIDDKSRKELEPEDYIKTIRRVSLTRVNNLDFTYLLDHNSSKFDYYDFHFEGSGFLRRQVRKMVGILLGIANGKISIQDIQYMLDNPHERNWNPLCSSANADGLFLKSVCYTDPPIIRGFLSS